MQMQFLLSTGVKRFGDFFRSIPGQFSEMGGRDVLDILYLSVILFFVFSFIRERRAGGFVIGIAVWSIVYGVSCILDLYAVRTVLGAVFSVGVIALVIIFQSEIRDMLQRIGLDSFRNIRSTISSEKQNKQTMHDESIEAVCQAASELSRLKTGALIVFERADQLGDVIRSGIEIDAKVSPYLLRNIFFDKSPLHDGAVVIRNRRLCAAGCLLPLSRRSNLDPSLGTRHRAAIGMSENSDAAIVIVSEETGIVSVAYKRQITRNLTYSTLKAFLYKVMLNQLDEETDEEGEENHERED
jgi:diadenylate cyclase